MNLPVYDAVVVGGGFFGCSMAVHLAGRRKKVLLLEQGDALMQRASYVNQARVHNGYHYPRSLMTALRSRVNYPRFLNDYRDCIVDSFDMVYAVPYRFSKVSAAQFRLFMDRIGAPMTKAPPHVKKLFDGHFIEEAFQVTECAFDAVKLKNLIETRLRDGGAEVRLKTAVTKVSPGEGVPLAVFWRNGGETGSVCAREVLNCTYSRTNELLKASGLKPIPLKHELTEMALIEVPPELKSVGVTVMCGPFFSTMPFPPLGLHTLSHVRYTPHCHWSDERDPYDYFERAGKQSRYIHMIKDASRYLPLLGRAKYVDSLWEIKTLLPKSEVDDGRPILFKGNYGYEGLTCMMGGKIDNIYDAISEFEMTCGRT